MPFLRRYLVLLFSVSLLLTTFGPAAGAVAQPVSPPFYHNIPDAALDYSHVEIKFAEGSGVRLRNGTLTSLSGVSMTGISSALADPRVQRVERLFTRSEAALDADRAQLASTADIPDLNLWYMLTLTPGTSIADAKAYIDALNTLPEVQIAYPAPRPAPPPQRLDVVDATPDFSDMQGYGGAAPNGIGLHGLNLPGIDGQGVTVVDIEYDWNFDHEDLPIAPSDLIAGDLFDFFGSDHGTAVLGQIFGIPNGFGVTGLTPGATAKVASPIFNNLYRIANAINLSASQLQAGDVILIEQQVQGPTNPRCNCGGPNACDYYVPVEYFQASFDAIKNATARGIVVVEAGANGGVNLNDPVFGNLFNRNVRDSGAILVGAAQSWSRVPHCWSNAGPRIDLFAWGDSITTTGYGDLYNMDGLNALYTANFGGTSGASPIITSAVVALQGVAMQRGAPLTPAQVRRILTVGGTPQGASPRQIGVMPNMTSAIEAIPPTMPELVSPVGSETVLGVMPTLVWTANPPFDQVSRYRVSLFDDAGVLIRQFNVEASACAETCSLTISGVALRRGHYRWRVQARNARSSRASVIERFRLEAPAPPVLQSPLGDITTTTPAFTWERVGAVTQYRVRLFLRDTLVAESGWRRVAELGCSQPGDTCDIGQLGQLPNGPYRWDVQARNNALFVGASRRASATFTVQFPAVPAAISPVSDAPVETSSVELTWQQAPDAAQYRVQVRNARNRQVVVNTGWVNGDTLCLDEVCGVLANDLANRRYEWRVQARNTAVAPNISTSGWQRFRVAVPLLEAAP